MSDDDKKPQQPDNTEKKAPSKMPSLDEVTSMAGKLFKDIKKSVTEIASDYKAKRKESFEKEQANKNQKDSSDQNNDKG